MWYSFAPTKVQQARSATNQWTRNSITATAVVTEEVVTAGMQQWRDALRTSFNCTAARRYSLNRRYLLSPALTTDRLNTLAWILSSTLTVRSRIWMCPWLLPARAIRPWSQQPAQNQDLWPKERKRTNLRDIHTSTSFLSYLKPQADLARTVGNSFTASCEMPLTRHKPSGTPGQPSKVCSTASSPNNNSQLPLRDPQVHSVFSFKHTAAVPCALL